MSPTRLIYRLHAIQRMFQRHIEQSQVRQILVTGEVIEEYPDDTPYPSRLILGWSHSRPLHVVAAYNAQDDETIIVTVYEPDPWRWSQDFRRRVP